METLEELQREADKVIDCIWLALDFRNHEQRDWIDEATLGRWFYEGASELVGNFIDVKREVPACREVYLLKSKVIGKLRGLKNALNPFCLEC